MTARRHILVIDTVGGQLANLSGELETGEYSVITAPNCGAALLLVQNYSKLCFVLVNTSVAGASALRFSEQVHLTQPDIPVIWIGDTQEAAKLSGGENSPHQDAFLSSVPSAEELRKRIDTTLRAEFYPDSVIEKLARASVESLAAFHVAGNMSEPFLKANRTSLAELNAVLSFSGDDTAGHLLVGCSQEVARFAAAKLFSRRKRPLVDRDIADVLGELTNRILGQLLWYFESRGTPVRFGLPVYLEGSHGRLWNERRSPSLGLEFEAPNGTLFVELSFTQLGDAKSSEPLVSDVPSSGGCVYL